MAGVKVDGAAPENPFGDAGSHLPVTVPVCFDKLHREMNAALPGQDVHVAYRAPQAGDPGPDSPGHLWWVPAALSGAVVGRLLQAHDPAPDPAPQFGGPGFPERLSGVRKLLAAGETLSLEELTSAVALLVGLLPDPA